MKNHQKAWILDLCLGRERSGKTFYCEKIGNLSNKNGKTIVAYNVGRDDDFSDYEPCNFLGFQDTLSFIRNTKGKEKANQYKINKSMLFFEYKSKVYRIKDFNAVLGGKKLKIERLFNRRDEANFFKSIYRYTSNIHLIGDDFRAVTRYGMPESLTELCSRKAHTGKSSSIDTYNFYV